MAGQRFQETAGFLRKPQEFHAHRRGHSSAVAPDLWSNHGPRISADRYLIRSLGATRIAYFQSVTF